MCVWGRVVTGSQVRIRLGVFCGSLSHKFKKDVASGRQVHVLVYSPVCFAVMWALGHK